MLTQWSLPYKGLIHFLPEVSIICILHALLLLLDVIYELDNVHMVKCSQDFAFLSRLFKLVLTFHTDFFYRKEL